MNLTVIYVILLIKAQRVACAQFLLSNLTGPYHVGRIDLELIDYLTLDPFASVPSFRDLMVSIFYPTHDITNHTLAPDFPPKTAAFGDQEYGLPSGSVESLYTRSYLNAPLSDPSLPLLLFSPGFGNLRGQYSAALEDVSSQGYIVVSMDHPYDSSFVEYPDGRIITSGYSAGRFSGRDSDAAVCTGCRCNFCRQRP